MMQFFSPAKINLFLRILGKRPDGYHEIASLFQTIDLGDTLTFDLAKEDLLTCSDPELPCDNSNLVMKAVDLFRRKSGLCFSIRIHLDKKIPTQAGLGGGSSNAATTLWALNVLHGNRFTKEELQQWGAEIGSDVAFFFSSGTAYCTGRGEKIRPLPPIPFLGELSLVKPQEGLSTPAIYKDLRLEECSNHCPEALLETFYTGTPAFTNDLEPPALRLCKALAPLKKELQKTCQTVWMTGSGTALICQGKAGIPISPMQRQESWY